MNVNLEYRTGFLGRECNQMNAVIKLQDVNVYFSGEWILRNLSFTVHPGEFWGIIGPNGAGKTTLLRVLLGMINPQTGTVQIMGKEISSAGSSLIGYVPQSREISPETPLIYANADTQMKREAIEKATSSLNPLTQGQKVPSWQNDEELIKRLYGLL
jgi:ABC-type Mn2+/Zn2+ transport system ATPase subunit